MHYGIPVNQSREKMPVFSHQLMVLIKINSSMTGRNAVNNSKIAPTRNSRPSAVLKAQLGRTSFEFYLYYDLFARAKGSRLL